MKYIDADRLKELLDGKYKEFTEKAKKDCPLQYQYMANGLEIAKQFIDSLQQEQLPGIKDQGIPGKDFIPVDWVDACEKYGKWEIVKVEQPSLPDNLDEAELKYVESLDNPPANQEEERIIYQTFKAGAEWMSKQMNNDKRKDNCSIYH